MRIKLLCIGLSALAFAAGAFARDAPFHKLTLYVANQSFDVNPVDVKVTIDGVTVAAGAFYAGYGRSWRRYDVRLVAGRHVLRALTRKGGAALKREFTVTGPRWRTATACPPTAPGPCATSPSRFGIGRLGKNEGAARTDEDRGEKLLGSLKINE